MTKLILLCVLFLVADVATLSLGLAKRPRLDADPSPGDATRAETAWIPPLPGIAVKVSLRPPRPEAKGDLRETEAWLRRLWLCCLAETRTEVDQACQDEGPLTAIEAVRRQSLEGPVAPPPMRDGVVGREALQTYDFASWFRRLQLVRSVPYVVRMYATPDVVRAGEDAMCAIVESPADPTLARLAASTFSFDGSFIAPRFRARDDGVEVDLLEADNYAQVDGFADAAQALEDLSRTLTLFVREDREVLGRLSRTLGGRPDPVVRRLLQAALPLAAPQ